MAEQSLPCAIAIMAKAPRPGRSKTRLCPPLSPEDAATLSGAFIRDMTGTVHRAAATAPITVHVAYAPAGTEPELRPHLAPGTALLLADGASVAEPGVTGFGRCLLETLRLLFAQGHARACVLNSDSPTLPARLLAQAAQLLAAPQDRVVLGPATDGGYYLLGARAPHAALFADIAWSTEHVAAQTRRQAAQLGLEVIELDPWYDVDDAPSLQRLLHDLRTPAIATRAPATIAALARLPLAHLPLAAQLTAPA